MSNTVQELDYNHLLSLKSNSLSPSLKSALLDQIKLSYGSQGLGILTIKNVPGYSEKRQRLLKLAQKLANLSQQQLEEVKDPKSNYQVGWSHGIEVLQNGKKDLLKGSFYGNVKHNVPTTDQKQMNLFPSYTRPNVWPKKSIPELENAFMELGGLIHSVGLLLGHACDEYIKTTSIEANSLEQTIQNSRNCKGRLLHYFPKPEAEAQSSDMEAEANWCGLHCDHGTLTGLCRAIYLDPSGNEVPSPDPKAGLYILVKGEEVKVSIPKGNLGFQLGQAAQIQSGGALKATPHLVRGADSTKISRNTFAVFLQPHWQEKLEGEIDVKDLGVSNQEFHKGISFGQFSENLVRYYHANGTENLAKL